MRNIETISKEIKEDWKTIPIYAKVYLDVMIKLGNDVLNEYDKSIILGFLANAQYWKGETARRIKKELNGLLKES